MERKCANRLRTGGQDGICAQRAAPVWGGPRAPVAAHSSKKKLKKIKKLKSRGEKSERGFKTQREGETKKQIVGIWSL